MDAKNTAMWAPMLEKAWAKVMGSYDMADGGFFENGLSALTGAPVFKHSSAEIENQNVADAAWSHIRDSLSRKYLVGASTSGNSNTKLNSCGTPESQVFNVFAAFELVTS